MYVRESLTSRGGLGDSRIADGVSRRAMTDFVSTNRAALVSAFQRGQGSAPTQWDPGTWAAGAFSSMADAFSSAFGTQPPPASTLTTDGSGSFEPEAPTEGVPQWVYWAGAGAVVVLVGAVVYKKRKG